MDALESVTLAPVLQTSHLRWQFRQYLPDPGKVLVVLPNGEKWIFDGRELVDTISRLTGG